MRQPPEPCQLVALEQGEAVRAVEPLAGIHLFLKITLASGVHACERTSAPQMPWLPTADQCLMAY
jgi:hypothetical protein